MAINAVDRIVGGIGVSATEQERRQRGAKHAVRELMQKFGFDPVENLIQAAQNPSTPLDMRIDISKTLAPFLYPKLNAVTIQGDEDGGPVRFRDERLLQRILSDPEAVAAAQKLGILSSDAEDEKNADESTED